MMKDDNRTSAETNVAGRLKRLIEASARMEMRGRVKKEDVWRTIEIFSIAIKQVNFTRVKEI